MNNMTCEVQVGANTALEKLAVALQQEVAAGKSRKMFDFNEAYPLIEQHLANNGSQKTACDKFNDAYGYKLHQPQFRKLLNAERKRRAATGDAVRCLHCDRPLHSAADLAGTDDSMEGE
jgi:hypothetical protein